MKIQLDTDYTLEEKYLFINYLNIALVIKSP